MLSLPPTGFLGVLVSKKSLVIAVTVLTIRHIQCNILTEKSEN